MYTETSTDKDLHLKFLAGKISSIRKAIFRADSDAVLKLPNNVIDTINVDENGHVFFLTFCNRQHFAFMEKDFYASLEYYQKGEDTRLIISGKAHIAEDGTETGCIHQSWKNAECTQVFVQLKIMKAEYFYTPKKVNTIKEKIKHFFYNFLPLEPASHYDFS